MQDRAQLGSLIELPIRRQIQTERSQGPCRHGLARSPSVPCPLRSAEAKWCVLLCVRDVVDELEQEAAEDRGGVDLEVEVGDRLRVLALPLRAKATEILFAQTQAMCTMLCVENLRLLQVRVAPSEDSVMEPKQLVQLVDSVCLADFEGKDTDKGVPASCSENKACYDAIPMLQVRRGVQGIARSQARARKQPANTGLAASLPSVPTAHRSISGLPNI